MVCEKGATICCKSNGKCLSCKHRCKSTEVTFLIASKLNCSYYLHYSRMLDSSVAFVELQS